MLKSIISLILFTFIFSVDYTTEIQPIFNNNCGGCHTTNSSGGLNLLSYVKFMELNPYHSDKLTNNPYKSLPDRMLIYRSCYPIRFNNVNGLIIALESIRDPGNLGTSIRTCDWFGVNEIICSLDSVDCYNHKVIQASMGSLSRVSIKYLNLKGFLKSSKHLRIGTTLNGSSIYDLNLNKAVLVFGNESKGISDELIELIDSKVTIPRFQKNNLPESLNLASSVAIILGEIKRKEL